ncbi:MAG TPA: aminoacyl-tRNA hydrolase [Candidatus Wallbacteria bacterium]|nr:MAG: Peptidyl-tRNA hydrolase [bacterium ADurb.Bin243]HPG57505.1 aminoacyl-tRNA hydrolase [Candidatus Wallbacteria bacterium]
MHLICGLGNPGRKYSKTRHNIGFMVVDSLVSSLGYSEGQFSNKFKGECLQVRKDGLDFIALKPQTYMNLSGDCVRDVVNYFKIDLSNVIIICDDVNLPFAKLRLRLEGSDGGHNGLKSIFSCLQTNKITRLRVGVSGRPENRELADYVLENFSKDEQSKMDEVLKCCSEAVRAFMEKGSGYAMNNFNNKLGYKTDAPEGVSKEAAGGEAREKSGGFKDAK